MMRNSAIIMLSPDRLRPTEETDPARLAWLLEKIGREGVWTQPICVEAGSLVVMDGHHRLAVALRLGLQNVPCIGYSYAEVRIESRRPGFTVSADDIIGHGLRGELFPAKTTRHYFPEDITCRIGLDVLLNIPA